jgi:predicted amidohydrolase YtcJ
LVCGIGSGLQADEPPVKVDADVVLRGGTLVDGTGAPARKADVAIKGDRIVAVGTFDVDPKARVIDASRLIVAPGFIDLHTHSDSNIGKPRYRTNENYQRQGVATVVTGNCGGGPVDVEAFFKTLEAGGLGTNVIHLVPLGSVRAEVMGNVDRAPSSHELEAMRGLVDRGMKAGAWGVSTGLIYVPGRYAETSEIVELARVAARHGGIYASHIRNEGENLFGSIEEAIAIGRRAKIPVHISHLKASGKANWGTTAIACKMIERARNDGERVTADQYPYMASSTKLGSMVVPHWALQGSAEQFARLADDPQHGPRLRKEIQAELDQREGGATIRIARYAPKPSRVGRDLVAIAKDENTQPLEIVLDIQRHGGAQAISFGMSEDDVRDVMRHDFVATASDGGAHVPGSGDQPHPRSYGTFPRKIRYALDDKVISLEAAIRAGTGLPARILGLADRGEIRPGAIADLIAFDTNTFRDAATFDKPTAYALGLRYLLVNGVIAIDAGESVKGVLPGKVLRLTKDGPADLILKIGRIWTGDRARPWATAVASRGGTIVGVGSFEEIQKFQGRSTRVIDRPEAFATPGLIDSHTHMVELGAGGDEVDLRGVASLDEVARRVKAKMEASPGDGWITGQSWDQSLWPGGAFPTAKVLDAVAPDRPVWLSRVDGHAGWANSEAMRRAKITRESKAPSDGQIIVDGSGEPTGVFIDGAKGMVSRMIPGPTKAEMRRHALLAQDLVLKAGLTGVHDAGMSNMELETFRELDRDGKLKLRVYAMASGGGARLLAMVSQKPELPRPDGRFVNRAIKIFMDGAMGSRGGLLFSSYSDDPGNSGLMLFDPKLLETVTTQALRNGWQVCTHAIGDKANALVLDAYAAARKSVPEAHDPRLRIEHAQVVRKEDVGRFRTLGVIASMQPSHSSDDMRWADARLGPGRVDGAYAWRWFLDAGVPLAFGSDFPVEIVNPFWGIYAAITRQDDKGLPVGGWHPNQILTLDETLRAFTGGSAFAEFEEGRLGVIREGMKADLTIVDRDLFKVSPLDVLKSRVVMTVVDGEIVFEHSKPGQPGSKE